MTKRDERLLVASADGHVGPPTPDYRPFLDPADRDRFDDFLAEHVHRWSAAEPRSVLDPEAWAWWRGHPRYEKTGVTSLWDPAVRLAELDRDGVAVEVLFPDDQNENTAPWLGGGIIQPGLTERYPAALRLAGARAYNRWLAAFCQADPTRLIGTIAIPTLEDVDGAVAEMRRAHAEGLRHAVMLALEYHQPLLHHPRYAPFWAACSELDLTVAVHLGDGSPHWLGDGPWDFAVAVMETFFLSHRPLWCLVFGGVLERHPDLRIVFTEQGADWVPGTLEAMDGLATGAMWRAAREHPLPRLPSEYWHRQCFVANSLMRRPDVEQRAAIGVDQMVFGSDFGHHEGMWPEIPRIMREMFEGCPHEDVAKIVGENFLRAYKVDENALRKIAGRIGPTAAALGAA
ncbi:MAG: amidohydrolase family protein [Myxococcota bacterium]